MPNFTPPINIPYTSPAVLGEAYARGQDQAVGGFQTALQAEQIGRQRAIFEQEQQPLWLDEIKKNIPEEFQKPLLNLAQMGGYVEQSGGRPFIRKGKYKEFHTDFMNNKVHQTMVLDSANKQIMGAIEPIRDKLIPVQQKYDALNAQIDQDLLAIQMEEARTGKLQSEKKYKLLEKRQKYQDEDDYKGMVQGQNQMNTLWKRHESNLTQMGMVDKEFEKMSEKYGTDVALRAMWDGNYLSQVNAQEKIDAQRGMLPYLMQRDEGKYMAGYGMLAEKNAAMLETVSRRLEMADRKQDRVEKQKAVNELHNLLKGYDTQRREIIKMTETERKANPEAYKKMIDALTPEQKERLDVIYNSMRQTEDVLSRVWSGTQNPETIRWGAGVENPLPTFQDKNKRPDIKSFDKG